MKRSAGRYWAGYAAYLVGIALLGGYALSLGWRTLDVYDFLKSDHRGFRGKIHRAR